MLVTDGTFTTTRRGFNSGLAQTMDGTALSRHEPHALFFAIRLEPKARNKNVVVGQRTGKEVFVNRARGSCLRRVLSSCLVFRRRIRDVNKRLSAAR
jgi:hypothetical protein